MRLFSSIRQARLFSSSALIQRFSSFNWVSQSSSNRYGFLGCLKSYSAGAFPGNEGNPEKSFGQQTEKENISATYTSDFRNNIRPLGQKDFRSGGNLRPMDSVREAINGDTMANYRGSQFPGNYGNLERSFGQQTEKENISVRYASAFRNSTRPLGQTDFRSGRNPRSMDFVREAITGDTMANYRGSQFLSDNVVQNEHFAHIKLMRNNTFVTVTDSNGNKKCGASAGVPGLLGASKVSKYAAEAVAEYAGRKARRMGIKSVVVRVKGFTHFKRKKQAILSFREGFKNPIVFIEDVTRHPHNGCRLPKKRRI
ncbi:putative ribosomal protein S11 [Hibiscus syriacus]|uniref:Ribosomal protein S11 n=1 Tax=Hibiscus syriacus TaxID=106335 RepID=A0A6A3B5D6_HIBSY|nr:probable ribosomal protein S11, mitochondrial [Hibiscus syriacus]KAE8712150.1 putative ribosomal protein S11 [Hibiscus syriacus]